MALVPDIQLTEGENYVAFRNYKVGQKVIHNGSYWVNVTGNNSEPTDSSTDWVFIGTLTAAVGASVTGEQGIDVTGGVARLGGQAITETRTISITSSGLGGGLLRLIPSNSSNDNAGNITISPENFSIAYQNTTNNTNTNVTVTPAAASFGANAGGIASTVSTSNLGLAMSSVQGGDDSTIELLPTTMRVNSPSIGTPVVNQALVFTNTNGTVGQAPIPQTTSGTGTTSVQVLAGSSAYATATVFYQWNRIGPMVFYVVSVTGIQGSTASAQFNIRTTGSDFPVPASSTNNPFGNVEMIDFDENFYSANAVLSITSSRPSWTITIQNTLDGSNNTTLVGVTVTSAAFTITGFYVAA